MNDFRYIETGVVNVIIAASHKENLKHVIDKYSNTSKVHLGIVDDELLSTIGIDHYGGEGITYPPLCVVSYGDLCGEPDERFDRQRFWHYVSPDALRIASRAIPEIIDDLIGKYL